MGAEQPIEDLAVAPTSAAATSRSAAGAIGGAAAIIMAGNLASSVLGFARGSVTAATFGIDRLNDSWVVAQIVPQMFYDLTIGAAVSAALIPTFTAILGRDGRERLAGTVAAVLGLAWLGLGAAIVLLEIFAGPLVAVMLRTRHGGGNGHSPVFLVQLILPSLFFLGTSAVFLATLYAARRFTAASFASCFYHLGIICGALFLARRFGVASLCIGAVAGAACQAAIQLPALIRSLGRVRVRLALTPEVRHILRLYAPVALGLVISVVGQVLDIGFKWNLAPGAPTAMGYATTLIQFPIGITVAALGFATLRAISAHAAEGNTREFKVTLATGIRLVLFLTVPAALAYLALASPICSLIYQHRAATAGGVGQIAIALDGYAIQIPFVGLDQLLIAAFYARGDTVTPMLLGVLGVAVYVVLALVLQGPYHLFGLALANTIQNSLHGLILLVLLVRTIGSLRGFGLLTGIGKTLLAGSFLVLTALASEAIAMLVFPGSGGIARLTHALLPLAIAGAVYLAAAALARSEELDLIRHLVYERFTRQTAASAAD